MKCTNSIDDMGAPCRTPWFKISIIHYTAALSRGVPCVHFANPNTHKLLIYHASSKTLLRWIDSFPLVKCLLKVKEPK